MGNITRRTALAGTALLAAAPLSAAQAEAEHHPDAALILAGERLNEAWSRWDLIAEKCRAEPDSVALDAEYDAAYKACSSNVNAIKNGRARTLEGLRVKAKAISWCCSGDEIDFTDGGRKASADLQLVNSIIRTLLGVV